VFTRQVPYTHLQVKALLRNPHITRLHQRPRLFASVWIHGETCTMCMKRPCIFHHCESLAISSVFRCLIVCLSIWYPLIRLVLFGFPLQNQPNWGGSFVGSKTQKNIKGVTLSWFLVPYAEDLSLLSETFGRPSLYDSLAAPESWRLLAQQR